MWRRSAAAGSATPSRRDGAFDPPSCPPQAVQYRRSGDAVAPQCGHVDASGLPHDPQNRAASAFVKPQVGQDIVEAAGSYEPSSSLWIVMPTDSSSTNAVARMIFAARVR